MKTKTFEERVKKNLCTKKGEIKVAYSYIIENIKRGETKFHYFKWSGFSTPVNKRSNYECVLRALNLDYTFGNSAPRGGKEGEYIELKKSAINSLKPVVSDFWREHGVSSKYTVLTVDVVKNALFRRNFNNRKIAEKFCEDTLRNSLGNCVSVLCLNDSLYSYNQLSGFSKDKQKINFVNKSGVTDLSRTILRDAKESSIKKTILRLLDK